MAADFVQRVRRRQERRDERQKEAAGHEEELGMEKGYRQPNLSRYQYEDRSVLSAILHASTLLLPLSAVFRLVPRLSELAEVPIPWALKIHPLDYPI